MSELDAICKLLERTELDIRIAAAVVLAELRPKSAQIAKALTAALDPDIPPLTVPLLRALEHAQSVRVVDALFPLTVTKDKSVQNAAVRTLVAYGDGVVAALQARHKSHPEERPGLDRVLAELGGKSAFSTLLSGLVSEDPENARRAALTVREHAKDASAADKRAYAGELERFLARIDKEHARAKISDAAALAARTGALKIMGYLEDARAVPTLMAVLKDKKAHPSLRKEAILALRFCLHDLDKGAGKAAANKDLAELTKLLCAAAAEEDPLFAQTALHTLGSLPVSESTFASLAELLLHPDESRARFVAERLADAKSAGAAKALVHALVHADRTSVESVGAKKAVGKSPVVADRPSTARAASEGALRARAEWLLAALEGNPHAATPMAEALLESKSADVRWLLRSGLRAHAKQVPPALAQKLTGEALSMLEKAGRGHEAALDIALLASPKNTVTALRALAVKLGKKKESERQRSVLEILLRGGHATEQDRYELAVLTLAQKEAAHRHLEALARTSFDLCGAMRKDKRLTLEDLYSAGFYLAERELGAGQELLEEVLAQSPRSKLGKAAKNKLALLG